MVMVYLDFEAVAFLGAAFLAVPKENSGLAFAAVFFATGFFATGFFATGFFAAGLALGLPTMGLTAAFLGAAGAFLPKSATAAWGCASRDTRKGGRDASTGQPRREVARTNKKKAGGRFSIFE